MGRIVHSSAVAPAGGSGRSWEHVVPKKRRGTWVPDEIMDLNIPLAPKVIWARILRLHRKDVNFAFISVRRLASYLKIDKDTVVRHTHRLVNLGLLMRIPQEEARKALQKPELQTTCYRAVYPAERRSK